MSEFVQFKSADPKVVYDLTAADRDLDANEIEAEEKAEKFSLREFPRISPIPGRIGFLLRNLHNDVATRNEMVINFVGAVEGGSKRKFIRTLQLWWDVLDDYSKRRVDIFDLFCEKYQINRARLWAVIQEGMYWNDDAISRSSLSAHKNKLIEQLKVFAAKEKNHNDRKLLAEAIGLIGGDAPKINVEDNRQIVNNTLNVGSDSPIPSFSDTIRRSDKFVRQPKIEETPEPRALTEGEQNYLVVDGFIVGEDDKELVERKTDSLDDLEKELIEAGKEI